jgi:hypothetical protein
MITVDRALILLSTGSLPSSFFHHIIVKSCLRNDDYDLWVEVIIYALELLQYHISTYLPKLKLLMKKKIQDSLNN